MPQRFSHIDVRVVSLGELFAAADVFELPWFQRSYAWGEEHIDRLITDVAAALAEDSLGRYFLGHVCLAGRDGDRIRIIDGQQRIMTLTMIYAVMRDLAPAGVDTRELDALIRPGSAEGARHPRVLAQDCVRAFLATAVFEPGASVRPIDPYRAGLADAERRFLTNRDRIASRLAPTCSDPAHWSGFLRFLVDRCYVIVQTVDSEEEAWDMLAKEEERRATHHPSELAKASMINVMARDAHDEAGRIWDDVHALLGGDNVWRLLGHLRTMLPGRRTTKPLVAELSQRYALNTGGLAFLRDTLQPYAGHLHAVIARRIGSGDIRAAITERLDLLDLVEHDQWIAPLLRWLAVSGADERETLAFVRALDHLALVLRIAGVDPTTRDRRFFALTAEIKSGARVAALRRLAVDGTLRGECEQNLKSRTLQYKRYAPYVLRRLSWQLGDRQPPGDDVTVEHILPRNPPAEGAWRQAFATDRIVDDNTHRLGNLALLTFAENQEAGSRPWPDKQRILARSRYALAREAARSATWTPEAISTRTDRLAALVMTG